MNHQIPQYNQNIPMLSHTDWASMAKQWATLRANVNIPSSINKVESYTYHNIPPPPPPLPNLSDSRPGLMSYNNDFRPNINQDSRFPINRISQNFHINTNVYEPPMHSIYEEGNPSNTNSQCETFDYNHRDRPFVNFNSVTTYNRPPSTPTFSQNIFNLPPPTHQDFVETQPIQTHTFQDPTPPKLFPIDVKSQPILQSTSMPMKIEQPPPFMVNKFDNQADFSTTRSTKGLPAWIIDDMKKIKEKEKKQPIASIDDYRDHYVNSKRDEEGDIVMEDANKESDFDLILSGKSVITTNRIDSSATDIDIDDVNLNDEDDGFDKIDYSSKSLIDLIEMLDENELGTLKMVIIRDSLTGVMKEVTDDMITEAVSFTFSSELSKISVKSKPKSVSRDPRPVTCNSDATVKPIDRPMAEFQNECTSRLLGLDVYESDDEVQIVEDKSETTTKKTVVSEARDKWSTHKKSLPKLDQNSSRSKFAGKDESKDKKKSSSDTNSSRHSSKNKHKSQSRDHSSKKSKSGERHNRSPDNNHRSRSKNKNDLWSSSNKKSKKHNSPDWRDSKWKNDKCESSNSSKKHNKHDRSRS